MDNPGSYNLCNRQIATEISEEIQTAVSGLDGILAATIRATFTGGTGGDDARGYVQTSIDNGESFQDVCCFHFENTAGTKEFNLSGTTPVTTAYSPLNGTIADDTAKDGILGGIWRVILKTGGDYTDTALVIDIFAR